METTSAPLNLLEVVPAQIARAYTGKPGCMCGCNGKYYSYEAHEHSTKRPHMVAKILKALQDHETAFGPDAVRMDPDGWWAEARVGNKDLVVYFKK